MHRMRKTDFAYVLHRLSYQESSFLLRCFTQTAGMISLLAKGAKKRRSSEQALLQPFQALHLHYSGRGSLPYLKEVDLYRGFATYPTAVLMRGFYVNELLVKLLPEQEAFPELFLAYQSLLADNFLEGALRKFEKTLLAQLGFGIDFETDLRGQTIEPSGLYGFMPERGFYRLEAQPVEALYFSGQDICWMAVDAFDRCLTAAKQLMQCAISHHLGERRLNTRQILLATSRI